MGQITNKQLLAWFGTSTESCAGADIAELDGKLDFTSRISQGGSADSSTPFGASLGIEYQTFQCGTGSLISSSEVPYEIAGSVEASLSENLGLIAMNFPVSVTLLGDGTGAGLYKITTSFKSNKPVYYNGSWWMWFDGSVWVISTPAMNKDGEYFMNNSDTPLSGPFGSYSVEGDIPAGALYTEDIASVLAVEDITAIITTEG